MAWRRKRTMSNYYLPEDRDPRCPSCKRDVDGLMSRRMNNNSGVTFAWCCPHCYVILGVSHRAGYILG
ncbi:MAG: hypothetical protein AAGD35_11025 [Actinomycetota bacterium]